MRYNGKYLKTSKNQITKGNSPVTLKLSVYDVKSCYTESVTCKHVTLYYYAGLCTREYNHIDTKSSLGCYIIVYYNSHQLSNL